MTKRLRRPVSATRGRAQRGATMIEVLVSVVILLIALLGTGGLIARSNQLEMESYQRSQALTLLQDMVSRINANRQAAACYASGTAMTVMGNSTVAPPTCTAGTGAQQATAAADLAAWSAALRGSAESSGGKAVGAMIGALGCIESFDAANQIYRVTVSWQGLANTAASALPCGAGAYGSNDALRRAVSVQVRIGALS